MVKERSKDRDVERNIVRREKDLQIQQEDSKIREAKYNKRYKEIIKEMGRPKYLGEDKSNKIEMGKGIRALVKKMW